MTDTEAIKAIAEEVSKVKPKDGKVVWITKDGAYEINTNFNPPIVKKLEAQNG